MSATVGYDDVEVGTRLPDRDYPLRRVDLVRYAGASGDFNVIHWSDRAAREVGLPGVIAHGMLTMAEAIRIVTDWVGDPGAVLQYGTRFTRPVEVPDGEDVSVQVSGVVAEKLDGRRVRIDLTATARGEKVLGAARAIVQLV
jgi:acyl dehydratase